MTEVQIKAALEKFEALIREQDARSDAIKQQGDFIDYSKLDKLTIGVCGGDGIGPIITNEAARVLEFLLKKDVEAGKIEFKTIDGLTIENLKDPQPLLRQAIPGPTSRVQTLQ